VFYELWDYEDGSIFNKDALRRNQMVKRDTPAPAERLYWRVEQLIVHDDGSLSVLWSRPEPFKNR
jgi:hypothetical protein